MFILKKAISPFLLPPGLFVLILICSGFFFFRKSFRAGLLNIGTGLLIWALSISPVSNRLLKGLEEGLRVPPHPAGDVIILLGGGLNGNVPTGDTCERIIAAASLYRDLHIPIIVSGGAVHPWEQKEAPIDAQYLAGLGVPLNEIIVEDKSRDTLENAKYVKKIYDEHDFAAPLLVTSAYHMKRALLCFTHEDMQATPYPAGYRIVRSKYHWKDYLPEGLSSSRDCLHEYLGIVYEKMFFRLNNIFGDYQSARNRLGLGQKKPAASPPE
ncbi:MAG: YdcF family protein [Nitrospiraceae bacterium]|nr:YdcF family protein [Nitrospiraceae bacterium]